GIDLNIDNYFRVIVFRSARNSRFEGVVNRYFGLTNDNEMEARGIALRRRDTPRVISRIQLKTIFTILGGSSLSEIKLRIKKTDFKKLIEKELSSKDIRDFIVRKSSSKPFWEYKVNAEHVRALRLMDLSEISSDVLYCYVKNSLLDVFPARKTRIDFLNKEKYFEKAMEAIKEIKDNI